ncbi:MAG: hypothetical protein K8Q89_02465 [Nitrosarchaeum sp.]|nr:hypothetical protein [Nitrosarchaeum sp.]
MNSKILLGFVLFSSLIFVFNPAFANPIDDTHSVSYGKVGTAVSLGAHIQNPHDYPVSASIEFVFEDIDSGNYWDDKKHTGTADANSNFVTNQSYFFKNTGKFFIHFVYEIDGKLIKDRQTTEFIIFKEYSDAALNGCSPEHKFVIKPNYGKAVCVFDDTIQKLVQRGWVGNNLTEVKHDSENYAPIIEIAVDPSDSFYFSGDDIVITGSVWASEKTDLQKSPVLIQVGFEDELVDIAQVQLSPDGTFSHHLKALGPLWQQSGIYTITASYDAGSVAHNTFGFSTYYQNNAEGYFANLDANNYEDLCGYPVTHEMRKDIVESLKQRHDDTVSLVELNQGVFTHVDRSLYLTDMPRLQYWYEIKDGKQVYFEIDACAFDNSQTTYVQLGPNYEQSQDIIIDGVHHNILPAPGSPLIYKDSLLPVLDIDNCQRVADNYTKEERSKLFTRETTTFDAAWENQVFPLMDYCTGIGTYELKTHDGNINWSFTEK